MKDKLNLYKAEEIAGNVIKELRPYCERIEVAGSIRRGCDTVGDIEIVVKPKAYLQQSMFNKVNMEEHSLLENYYWSSMGKVIKDGPRQKQIALPQGINLDLFIVSPPAQWGVIFAIRTGPSNFSRKIVTQRNKGGFLPSDLRVRHGVVWRGNESLATPEEINFLDLLGLGWVEPQERYAMHPGQIKLPVLASSC
jgi:DNA polymerase/3'-5' exonuclease PolX